MLDHNDDKREKEQGGSWIQYCIRNNYIEVCGSYSLFEKLSMLFPQFRSPVALSFHCLVFVSPFRVDLMHVLK